MNKSGELPANRENGPGGKLTEPPKGASVSSVSAGAKPFEPWIRSAAARAVREACLLLRPELASGYRLAHILFHSAAGCLTLLKVRVTPPSGTLGEPFSCEFHYDGKRWREGKPSAPLGPGMRYELSGHTIDASGTLGPIPAIGMMFEGSEGHPNPMAERLHAWLRRRGDWRSRTEISTRCFAGHLPAQQLSAAIDSLLVAGRIESRRVDTGAPIPRSEFRAVTTRPSRQV